MITTRTFSRLLFFCGISLVMTVLAFSLLSITAPVTAQDGGSGDDSTDGEEPTGDNSYCLVCHGETDEVLTLEDGSQFSLQIDSESFIHDIHGEESGLGCIDCHGEDSFPHVREIPDTRELYLSQYEATCTDCHGEVQEDQTVALSFGDISTSEALADTACLDCHPAEEEWETIHSQTLNHIDVSVESCTDCHETTVEEWHGSAHGTQQLACATCHLPSEERLRFETTEELCLNCHEDARKDFTHVTHVDQSCTDCHWDHDDSVTRHVLLGGVWEKTGHDLFVETRTCLDCHSDEQTQLVVAGEAAPNRTGTHPLIELDNQIKDLESDIEEKQEDGAGTATMRLIQSALIGLALGFMITTFVVRFSQMQRPDEYEEASDHENEIH